MVNKRKIDIEKSLFSLFEINLLNEFEKIFVANAEINHEMLGISIVREQLPKQFYPEKKETLGRPRSCNKAQSSRFQHAMEFSKANKGTFEMFDSLH